MGSKQLARVFVNLAIWIAVLLSILFAVNMFVLAAEIAGYYTWFIRYLVCGILEIGVAIFGLVYGVRINRNASAIDNRVAFYPIMLFVFLEIAPLCLAEFQSANWLSMLTMFGTFLIIGAGIAAVILLQRRLILPGRILSLFFLGFVAIGSFVNAIQGLSSWITASGNLLRLFAVGFTIPLLFYVEAEAPCRAPSYPSPREEPRDDRPEPLPASQSYSQKEKCPHCDKDVDAMMLFCPHCGNKLRTEIYCPSCGKKLESDAKYCSQCGRKMRE